MFVKLAPGAAVIIYLIFLTGLVFLRNYWVMLCMTFIASFTAYFLFKIEFKKYLIRYLILIPLFSFFIGFFAIFNFVTPGDPILKFNENFYITDKGINAFINFYLRILSISSLSGIYIMNTREGDFLKGLKSLHLPDEIILLFSLTFRYIKIFASDVQDFLTAKKLRIFKPLAFSGELRWTASRAFMLFYRGIRDSIEVSRGLKLRGVIDGVKYLEPEKIKGIEKIYIILIILFTAGILIIDKKL